MQSPGIIKLKPKMNALQAIVEAGGPKDTGRLEQVVLLRTMGDNQFGYRELNLMRILRHKDPADDAELAQDDLLFIPKTGIAKCQPVGAAIHPEHDAVRKHYPTESHWI